MFNQDQIPTSGFLLANWNQEGYRSTAHAYLKREGLYSIEHKNGRWYTLPEIESAMIR